MKQENILSKEDVNEIVNFKGYYNAGELDYGIHGPEQIENKVYLSIWHYLEFIGEKPFEYDTKNIGDSFHLLTDDIHYCKYKKYGYQHGKYDFNLLKKNMEIFQKLKSH